MNGYPQRKTALIEEDAGRAWAFALRAAARVGGYQDVRFEDLRIQAGVVACGGWLALCRSEATQHAVLWRRFLQGYRRAASGESLPRQAPTTQPVEVPSCCVKRLRGAKTTRYTFVRRKR